MNKLRRAGQTTDGNITRLMSFALWITKATDTRSEYETLIVLQQQQ